VTSDAAGDPRRRVLDAAHAVTSARAALQEAQVPVANSEQSLKALQAAETKFRDSVPQKTILDAEHEVRRNRAAVERLTVDLGVKERQLGDAQETLATQIKLRDIDVADAKLRLDQAVAEFSRANLLLEKRAIAKEQYEAIRVAQRLAESQYQRSQMLLELYRKALPGQETPTDKGQSSAEPLFKDVWMTDFAAAQAKALELHRPLVAYFDASLDRPSQNIKAEVLSTPKLLRNLAKHFVAVVVDVDADPKTAKQFDVNRVPTVLVLFAGDNRRGLARAEGTPDATSLTNLLNTLVPRTYAPAELPAVIEPAGRAADEKPAGPRPGASDPASNEKPSEATPKTGDRPNGQQQE
jgi:hypothetical protein